MFLIVRLWFWSGITILLSLSVFSLIVAEMVPSTSLAVPLIGEYGSHQCIYEQSVHSDLTGFIIVCYPFEL